MKGIIEASDIYGLTPGEVKDRHALHLQTKS
jgi:hypothetical protein